MVLLPRRRRGQAFEFDERRFLTREQLAVLSAEIPNSWRPLFELLASTGLRISEAIAPRLTDADLEADRWMGHHSAAFTLDHYGHLIGDSLGRSLDLDIEPRRIRQVVRANGRWHVSARSGRLGAAMAQGATEITVREVRALATALLPEVATLAEAMLEYLLERIPEAGGDEEIEGLTLGSCSSNIEQALSMVRHGIPVSATEAPVTALEHARAMAARGHSVDVMLRFYRLGHAFFIERLHREIPDVISDPGALLAALEELERFAFGYIDAISSQVAAEYVAELERRQNRARAVRTDMVRTLLAGTKVDLDAAERVLAHRLSGPQLAFVCWAPRGDVDLAPVGSAVAGLLGSTRPLLQPDGAQALWGWVAETGAAEPSAEDVTAVLSAGGEAVHVAFGEPQPGAAGFRASHLEALRAQRVVDLSGRPAPSATRFGEVALVDALSRDIEAARSLVARELGPLAGTGVREGEERAALLAVLDARGSLAAAAEALGVHRNTVLQRMRRAEERRGRSAQENALELHAALRLVAVLGQGVLMQS